MFHESHTFFIVVTRHPIGASEKHYQSQDCGRNFLNHWVKMHHDLLVDLPHLKQVIVVQYEHLMRGDTQRMFDAILETFNLPPNPNRLNITIASPETYFFANKGKDRREEPDLIRPAARKLSYLRGDREQVQVLKGMEFHWIDDFVAFNTSTLGNNTCSSLFARFEPLIKPFGYSLVNFTHITKPKAFEPYYIKGFDF
jgi:hypothetical protein